jgi:hypothetical protein
MEILTIPSMRFNRKEPGHLKDKQGS